MTQARTVLMSDSAPWVPHHARRPGARAGGAVALSHPLVPVSPGIVRVEAEP
ncbi:MAG: hypothetical protein AB7E55_34880 [Pigmentiphaga sp.]